MTDRYSEHLLYADAAVAVLCQPSDPTRAGDINGEGETLIRFKVIACCKTIRRAIPFDDIASVRTERVVERLSGVDGSAAYDSQRKEEKLIHDSV